MSNNKNDFVKEITNIEDNFTQWYTDVVLKAELADYADTKDVLLFVLMVMLFGRIFRIMLIRNLRSLGLLTYLCHF